MHFLNQFRFSIAQPYKQSESGIRNIPQNQTKKEQIGIKLKDCRVYIQKMTGGIDLKNNKLQTDVNQFSLNYQYYICNKQYFCQRQNHPKHQKITEVTLGSTKQLKQISKNIYTKFNQYHIPTDFSLKDDDIPDYSIRLDIYILHFCIFSPSIYLFLFQGCFLQKSLSVFGCGAILLASQGFSVTRIQDKMYTSHNQPLGVKDLKSQNRRSEIVQFMNQLQQLVMKAREKKQEIKLASQQEHDLLQYLQKGVNDYFNALSQTIQRQRKTLLHEIKQSAVSFQHLDLNVEQQCTKIKQDIIDSIQSINQASDTVYLPAIEDYWNKLHKLQSFVNRSKVSPVVQRRIVVGDRKQAQEKVLQAIDARLQYFGQNNMNLNKRSLYFSFDKENGKQDEDEVKNNNSDNILAQIYD